MIVSLIAGLRLLGRQYRLVHVIAENERLYCLLSLPSDILGYFCEIHVRATTILTLQVFEDCTKVKFEVPVRAPRLVRSDIADACFAV